MIISFAINETLKSVHIFYFRFAFKVVIASTAVYYTNQLEIWEPLSQQERAYDKAAAEVQKLINENKPKWLKLEVIQKKKL